MEARLRAGVLVVIQYALLAPGRYNGFWMGKSTILHLQ